MNSCFGKETWFVKDKIFKKDPDKDLMRIEWLYIHPTLWNLLKLIEWNLFSETNRGLV